MPLLGLNVMKKCCWKRTRSNVTFVGYAFQIEMKFKSWKFGYKIKEVPVIFTDRTGSLKWVRLYFTKPFGVIQMKIKVSLKPTNKPSLIYFMKKLLKNAQIINEGSLVAADVIIQGDRIVK